MKQSTDTNSDCSWVRIFEPDSIHVAETKAVHANLSVFWKDICVLTETETGDLFGP
jgi:hypothetical protein